jgi:hypothetical protein
MSPAAVVLMLALLLGLPVAVWLDLSTLSDAALRRQAEDLNSVITSMRGYYATNVVGRVLASPGSTQVVHNYQAVPGAIPIPATLSLELGRVISEQQHNIKYRFVSDYPFKNRAAHELDDFEKHALAVLRADPSQHVIDVSRSIFTNSVRLVTPVLMGPTRRCHDTHRKARSATGRSATSAASGGDHHHQIAANLFSFKYLLIYFA